MTGGTILCGVDGSRGARDALQLAGAVSERLGLRLVVAHVVGDDELVRSGERVLNDLAEHEVGNEPPERRLAIGDRAARLAEIAVEEGADLIVIGSPSESRRTFGRRGTLARELESATSCPVLIAPRQTRPRSELRLTRATAIGAS
jgi:nucleotide-binding universal stress UspA family protein